MSSKVTNDTWKRAWQGWRGNFPQGVSAEGGLCGTAVLGIARSEGVKLTGVYLRCYDSDCWCDTCVERRQFVARPPTPPLQRPNPQSRKPRGKGMAVGDPPRGRHSTQSQYVEPAAAVRSAATQTAKRTRPRATQTQQDQTDSSTQTDDSVFTASSQSSTQVHRTETRKRRTPAERRRYRRKVLRDSTVIF